MNKIIYHCFLGISIVCAFTACTPSGKKDAHFNQKSVALNDSAVKMQMNYISLTITRDSAVKAIDLWKEAIKTDPTYKLAYLNLWNFNNSMGLYNENIALCSQWLKNNPKDPDMLLKRGLIYEHLDKNDLADKDYKAVEQMVLDKPAPSITKNMNEREVEQAVIRAYNYLIVKKDAKKPLEMLSRLKEYFPNNTRVSTGYEVLKNATRKEYVNSLLGEHNVVENMLSF